MFDIDSGNYYNDKEQRKASQERYDRYNTKCYSLKLNRKTDADIIAWLNKQKSMQGAIKTAIREQIQKDPEGK